MSRYTETEYRRYTAVLREDQKNYAITPMKRPRGKATIEVSDGKGVLKCLVKNLRFSHDGVSPVYGVWLLSQDAGQILPAMAGIIDIGELQTGPVFQGHQLVGLQYDQKGAIMFLVHGIPGRFCLRDQPYGGLTGYIFWHPLPGQQYKAGDYGYWLIHIDPKSGEVVFPRKATKPPNCDECTRFD